MLIRKNFTLDDNGICCLCVDGLLENRDHHLLSFTVEASPTVFSSKMEKKNLKRKPQKETA
jgi:hypothetical protein